MTLLRSLRTAVPAALAAAALATSPAMAFQPSVEVVDIPSTTTGRITDLADRGSVLALTADLTVGGQRRAALYWSADRGATWGSESITHASSHVLESAVTVCGGHAVAIYAVAVDSGTRLIRSAYKGTTVPTGGSRSWTPSGTVARRPDAACVSGLELALAWFEKTSSGHRVVLETGSWSGFDDTSPQRFTLGAGTPGRGLSIAATADRVYVAWFSGSTLKVRRYRIGTTPARTLTYLGTRTVGTIRGGTTPRIGADGSRVILAYTQGADLKVRRSTNKGVSFASAKTLRNLPDASEVGSLATSVRVKGSLVAIGTIDVGGIDTLYGDGRGYRSTNGGSSYTRLSTHAGGRVLAAVVKVGSGFRYAEVWDHSLEGASPGEVRFRRK